MNRRTFLKSGLVCLLLLVYPKLVNALPIERTQGEGITFKTAQSFLGTVLGVGEAGIEPRFSFDYNGLNYETAAYTDRDLVNQPLRPDIDTVILDYMAPDAGEKSNLNGVEYLNVPQMDYEHQIQSYIINWFNLKILKNPVATQHSTWGSIRSLF